jgi:hypothetical protein
MEEQQDGGRAGKRKARPAMRRRTRKGPNTGGKSRWMRDFFTRPSPPLWRSTKSSYEIDTLQQ